MGMPLALRGNAGGKTQKFLLLLVEIKSLDASVSNKKPSLIFWPLKLSGSIHLCAFRTGEEVVKQEETGFQPMMLIP